MNIFALRLREQRNKHKLSQESLAKILSVGQRQISYYGNGESTPTLDSLIQLADYFEVSTDYLLGRTDNPEINK